MTRHRLSRPVFIATLVGVAVVLLAGASAIWLGKLLTHHDWLEQKLSEAVGRPVTIGGELTLNWQGTPESGWRGWVPTPVVRAEQVAIANATWAQQDDFASVGRVELRVPLLPLLNRTLDLDHVELTDAQLHLERSAEGEGNWNFLFGNNEGSGWQLELGTLRLGATTLQYTDTGLELDLTAKLTTARADHADNATAFNLEGRYREAKLQGSGTAGSLLSLNEPDVNYPIQVELHAGEVALTAQGRVGNLRDDPTVDLQVSVAGPSMTLLYPVTGLVLPPTAPFKTQGRLQGSLGPSQADWHYRDFTGHMGDSDLSGTLTYKSRSPRPQLEGQVQSEHLQLVDLGPLIGLEGVAADPAAADPEARRGHSAGNGRLIPNVPFLADRWGDMDIHVDYHAGTLQHGDVIITRQLTAQVRLQDRQLALKPLELTLGGGQARLELALDARERPVAGQLDLHLQGVALDSLIESSRLEQIGGTVQGNVSLAGHGESLAALVDASDGKLDVFLNNGHVRRSVIDMAALDVLNMALSKAFDDDNVPITCAHAGFDVKQGVATSRDFQLQTPVAYFLVDGTVNLKTEQIHLTVHPHTIKPRLFSLRSPLDIRGDLRHPEVHVDEGALLLRAGAAAAIGAIAAPALALLPLTTLGSDAPPPCIEPEDTTPAKQP